MTDTDRIAEIEQALSEAGIQNCYVEDRTVYELVDDQEGEWVNRWSAGLQSPRRPHEADEYELRAIARLFARAPLYLRYLLDRAKRAETDLKTEKVFQASLRKTLGRDEHALKSEREARQQFISDVSEGMECLPGCDSHGHEEGCPVADPMAAFRNLRENLQRAEAQCERLTVAARDAERVMAKHIYPKPDVADDHPYAVLCRLREALAAQPQENDDEETDA